MIALDSIREKLGVAEPWVESRGAHWLNPGALGIRDVARVMNEAQARFVTITAYQLPGDEGFRLEYHWDLDGRLLGFPFVLKDSSIESIFDLCEAVDWIEREVHEGFAIDFTGRAYEPLLLREGDKPGVNLREAPAPGKPAAGPAAQKEVAQ
jgi:NADH:ubiquinone oxidoreductase subunit C